MLTCFVCKDRKSCNVTQLFKHFRDAHWLVDQHAKYVCCESNCSRMFNDKFRYGKHLTSFHSDCLCDVEPSSAASCSLAISCAQSEQCNVTCNAANNQDPVSNSEKLDIKNLAARYLADCKSRTTTLQQAALMAKSCNSLVNVIVTDIAEHVDRLKKICVTDEQRDNIDVLLNKLSSYSRPFDGLETEYSFKKYLERSGCYVMPLQYVTGTYTNSGLQQDTGYVTSCLTESTGQYISVEAMIHALNSKTDLIATVLSYSTRPSNGPMLATFCDGLFWRRHPLVNENVILLRLYGDDFEPANPLGSRRTLYKIGTVYFQFENLPACLNSKVENIFLTLCYHSDDVKSFGWENVLKPLIKELQKLESEGMSLVVNGEVVELKVVVSCLTGDNLFLNSILGFTESFGANYPCRHCIVARHRFQSLHVEDETQIRTVDQYNNDSRTKSVAECGIRFPSPLNVLKYFHAAENYAQDIMHDLLEGICKYDMKLILSHVIKLPGMSLLHVNGLIENFSYGKHDITNKPVSLTENALKADMLPLTASQMWCLTRVLSLAVGALVPEDDNVWALYMQLRNVLDIVFAPEVSSDELILLKVLIEEYLSMRGDCFPQESLKNKHHHLVHYPRIIQEVGPLYRFWCMRFESKHQRAKTVMSMSCNFKNVPLTVATRHQYDVAQRMLVSSSTDAFGIKVGSGEVVMLSQFANGWQIDACMNNVGLNFELYSSNTVEVSGTMHYCGCYLLTGFEDETPVFVKLLHIFSRNQGEHCWFICNKLLVHSFSTHFHAWKVSQSDACSLISVDPKSLKYTLPLSVHCINDEKYVAGLRYHA